MPAGAPAGSRGLAPGLGPRNRQAVTAQTLAPSGVAGRALPRSRCSCVVVGLQAGSEGSVDDGA